MRLLLLAVLLAQSLGDLARREAERRRTVDEQGLPEKTILQQDVARLGARGSVSTSSALPHDKPPPVRASPPAGTRDSLARYRSTLQKLDREIRTAEDRIALLRARAKSEADNPTTPRRSSRSRRGGGGARAASDHRPDAQLKEWEAKLKRLRQDRSETYSAGRRAGFLPGELDGKGIWP
jgi:hypothetical protein